MFGLHIGQIKAMLMTSSLTDSVSKPGNLHSSLISSHCSDPTVFCPQCSNNPISDEGGIDIANTTGVNEADST